MGVSADEIAIQAEGLGKEYRIYGNPYHRLLEKLGARPRHRLVRALQDVNFAIRKGASVGIVGPNGAGKSTLLKILTGTTFPSHGRCRINGRVASLLELGAGFHQDFTGRENIYLNAALMGFSRAEMKDRFAEILEFSELEPFIDAPIRTYSSGMVCRLGFSIAISVDPDILIIDEILAVGDLHFQRKCVEKIWSFKERGKTIIFCSHSLYDVRQLCEEAIWIHEGRIRMHDSAVAVTNAYATYEKELVGRETDVLENLPGEPTDLGPKGPHIVEVEIVDLDSGRPAYEVAPLCNLAVRVKYRNDQEPMPLCLGIGFTRTDTTHCIGHTTGLDGVRFGGREGVVELRLPGLRLLSGEFVVFVWLMDERGVHRYHQALAPRNLVVMNRGKEVGLFLQEHEWVVHEGLTVRSGGGEGA